VVVGELGPPECAIGSLGLLEHWEMRLDPALVDQPVEHLRRPVSAIGVQLLGAKAEPVLDPVDHGACRPDLSLANAAAGVDVDDDRIIEIDQIVCSISEEGVSLCLQVHCAAGSDSLLNSSAAVARLVEAFKSKVKETCRRWRPRRRRIRLVVALERTTRLGRIVKEHPSPIAGR